MTEKIYTNFFMTFNPFKKSQNFETNKHNYFIPFFKFIIFLCSTFLQYGRHTTVKKPKLLAHASLYYILYCNTAIQNIKKTSIIIQFFIPIFFLEYFMYNKYIIPIFTKKKNK